MKRSQLITATALAAAALAGCAGHLGGSPDPAEALRRIRDSFRDEGIAKVEWLAQDEANAACSEALDRPLPEARAKAIEGESARTIQLPADGRFLGDWKRGEALAQSGRGMTFTDDVKVPNGGNCYNCHQLTKAEIAFGTIGPSLYQYGRLRGVSDPSSAAARPVLEYTWGKLWNARASNACSQMPRFGHKQLLTEEQLRDLMALLLDPASPVNAQ